MSDNLMEMIKGAVSPQLMGKLGGLLGQTEDKASSAFENVAGTIMGGLIKKSGTEQGANDIFKAAQEQDAGILDKLDDLLDGGGQQEEMMKSGGGMLDMVFGQQQSSLLGTIANFLGIDEGMMSKLMAMAAPIVMGVIGKYVKNKALDSFGLKDLLGGQKQYLAASMAPGLTDQLGFGDMLGNVTGAVGDAGAAASNVAKNMGGAASSAVGAAGDAVGKSVEGGGDLMKILLPVVVIAALAFGGWWLFNNIGGIGATKVTSTNLESISTSLDESFDEILKGLEDVKSVDDAKVVVGKMQDTADYLNGLNFSGVTDEEMAPVKAKMLNFQLRNSALSQEAFKIDGAKDVILPLIEPKGALSQAIEKICIPENMR